MMAGRAAGGTEFDLYSIRRKLRGRESAKIVAHLFEQMKKITDAHPPQAPIARAARYSLNLKEELSRFLHDPKLNIDNNPAYAARGSNVPSQCRAFDMVVMHRLRFFASGWFYRHGVRRHWRDTQSRSKPPTQFSHQGQPCHYNRKCPGYANYTDCDSETAE